VLDGGRQHAKNPPVQQNLMISRKIDYALRALIYLAARSGGRIAPLQQIAKDLELPREFLAKILKALTAARLVRSTRGAHGGYELSRSPREISFLDAIEAAGGPVQINVCLDHKDACEASSDCSMYFIWKKGQEKMLDVYRSTSLAELVKHERALVPLRLGSGKMAELRPR
jgi:Rrf2 family protein